MDSGAARSSASRVAGNRDFSGLRISVWNGDGRSRAVGCAIHMVRCIRRASGRLGSPALLAKNGLASLEPGWRPEVQSIGEVCRPGRRLILGRTVWTAAVTVTDTLTDTRLRAGNGCGAR